MVHTTQDIPNLNHSVSQSAGVNIMYDLTPAYLLFGMTDYGAKKKLLQHAMDMERNCAELLRTISALTNQANASRQNLTAGIRTALLVSHW